MISYNNDDINDNNNDINDMIDSILVIINN